MGALRATLLKAGCMMSPLIPATPAESAALEIVWRLRHAGHRAYWAGGCVRDRLLGLPSKDIDVATDATPSRILELFEKVLLVGARFGVCVVVQGDVQTEVATFRTEGDYRDHRHPEHLDFAGPEEDARRRDFTINALFFDPITEQVYDYVGGREDLVARRVRCVGDAEQRLAEDALRILRAVRFAARLDFQIEAETWEALRRRATDLRAISPERIRDELVLMLRGPRPAMALEQLRLCGALEIFLPEVAALHGVPQPSEYHPEGDVWEHTRQCLEQLDAPSTILAMATLLHDVGKPVTFQRAPDRIRFNNHAEVGAQMAEAICRRLRFSTAECEAITHLVRRHMVFMDIQRMRPAKLTRFLASSTIDDDLALHRTDCLASHGGLENYHWVAQRLAEARAAHPDILPPPLLTGDDLIALGYAPGPLFSEILKALEEQQLDGRITTPQAAREWVRESYPLPLSRPFPQAPQIPEPPFGG